MKKLFYLFLIIGLAITSCNKPDVLPTEVEVSFQASMGGTNFKAGDAPISAFDCNTDGATYAILVINNVSYTVDLIRDDNGSVYTQSIKLPVLASGVKYELTSFMLYDDGDNLILASPDSNAPFGEFVTAGLPIDFEVDGFYKVNIPIQVLCYTPTTIIEFGFSWFSFETVTVRELCFFGDICVDVDDYIGSIYEGQLYGLQHDMPAIFEVKVSIWDADLGDSGDWKEISVKNNEKYDNGDKWLGEGDALCIQYPDYEGIVDEYKIELSVFYYDGTNVVYVPFRTWVFTDNQGFPVTDQDGDGVIDFVIGDCVPNADIIIDPNDPNPDPGTLESGETAYAYDPSLAICFSEITEITSEKWGYSNGTYVQSDNTTYTLDLYAGAGRCVIEAGTLVGDLVLNYTSEGKITVTYNADDGVEFGDLHLYIGNLKYQSGNESVAPGQFTYTQDDVNGGTYTFDITHTFSGSIYIIAHAEVSPTSK